MESLLIIFKNIILSTLHGWVGASLAVFMFFRPLKPWRIGRFKIWQGIIPAQQAQIAEAISDVVAKELITPRILQDYLEQGQTLENQVRSAIHTLVVNLIDHEYPTLESILPTLAADLKEDLKKLIKKALTSWVEIYLKEPDVAAWFGNLSTRLLKRPWQKKLSELWPEEKVACFCSRFLDHMLEYVAEPNFNEVCLKIIDEQYQLLCKQTVPLGKVLPALIKEKIAEWPATIVQTLPELIKRLQDNEEMQERLTAVILDNMEQFKEKRFLARIGLDLYQFFNNYHKDVSNYVRYEMFPHLSKFLSSPEIQAWLEGYVSKQADKILEQPLGELAQGIGSEQLARTREWVFTNVRRWLTSENVRARLEAFLLGQYRTLDGFTLAELAQRYIKVAPEEVEADLVRHSLDLLRQPVTLRFVRLIVRSLVEELAHYRVGRLRDRFQPDTLEKVESTVVEAVISYLKSQIPVFLTGMDLKGIVKARIDSYSPKELVDMFQRVTMNNLQKIEIYGMIIGAAMGVFFGLANLRADAFWFIVTVLVFVIGMIRWWSRK